MFHKIQVSGNKKDYWKIKGVSFVEEHETFYYTIRNGFKFEVEGQNGENFSCIVWPENCFSLEEVVRQLNKQMEKWDQHRIPSSWL